MKNTISVSSNVGIGHKNHWYAFGIKNSRLVRGPCNSCPVHGLYVRLDAVEKKNMSGSGGPNLHVILACIYFWGEKMTPSTPWHYPGIISCGDLESLTRDSQRCNVHQGRPTSKPDPGFASTNWKYIPFLNTVRHIPHTFLPSSYITDFQYS